MTEFKLNLNHRPFEAIKDGTKTVEVRANKYNSINQMQIGDKIIFSKIGTSEVLQCSITRITLYPTVRDLLIKEDIRKVLSSGKNLDEGIDSIESISDYREQIAKNGVFAIVLQLF